VISIRLFGAIDLRGGDGQELRGVLAQPKRLALLAYLAAAEPAGPHRRDTLLGLFWPELNQDRARNNLSQAVHFLRRWLGDAAITSRGGEDLALEDSLVWVDVRAFHAAHAAGRPDEALELYRGDLLPSFFVAGAAGFEQWLERERGRLRGKAAVAARRQAERFEHARQLTQATGLAHRALELADVDERHVCRMIELLSRVGDRAGAVQAYERFASSVGELGVDPAPETVALIGRVRSGEHVEASPPLPSSAASPMPMPVTPSGDATRVESVASALARLTAAVSDRYKVERQIGAGAMAVVVLAQDLRHRRPVAIKVLRPELAVLMGPERFLREIEIAAALVHPHILPLHDSGDADGVLYYIMPYIAGESLRDRLDREPRLPVAGAMRIAREVADALGHAHAQGFVHLDIKPENILLGGDHALVADFGIARAIDSAGGERLSARHLSGTPAYMSPEQARGDGTVNARTDVYALGCVLHEMLAGEPPFTGATVGAVISRRLHQPAPRVSVVRREVPQPVDEVIARCLASDGTERFATGKEFAEALARVESAGAPGRGLSTRLRWGGAVAAALVALVAWLAWPAMGHPSATKHLAAIAVLPFRNLGDSADGYLAEDLVGELNRGLARLDGIAVRPEATVRAEASKGGDPIALGRRLEVTYVLGGSVSRDSGGSQVRLELVRVDAGVTRWSRTYPATDADLFTVRQSVAGEIARALSLPLTPAVRAALARRATTNRAARDLYLMASHFRSSFNLEGAERAVDLFGQAIARDSSFAEAWVGLAGAYQLFSQLGGRTPIETLVLWRRAIDRAIALDTLNGEAFNQRAQLHAVFEWDYSAADHDFRQAIALSPGSEDAYMTYAQFLNVVGLDDSALAVMRRAITISPTDPVRVANLAPRLRMVGRPVEAASEARRALALDSNVWVAHLMLAQLADDQGRLEAAALEAEQAYRITGDLPFVLGTLGRYYGLAGHRTQAASALARLNELGRQQHVERVYLAEALIGVDDRPGALDALEESARSREPDLPWKLSYGHLDRLRGEPRYGALLKRVGVSVHRR
jgi:DNA-binding SARP family transcriptional activator/TolB-like protein/tetratricopeptide (TPR) repeat protein